MLHIALDTKIQRAGNKDLSVFSYLYMGIYIVAPPSKAQESWQERTWKDFNGQS